MYTKQQIEALITECNDLRDKQADLLGRIDLLNSRLQQMLSETPKTETFDLEVLMASLKDSESDIEEAIVDAFYNLSYDELDDMIDVELSLSGNEIETELSTKNRHYIERFVNDYIISQVMDKLEVGIAHYLENLNPKANDTI